MHVPLLRLAAFTALLLIPGLSRATVPSPREHFGFAIGDDYQLANYTETEAYFKKLAAHSSRVRLVDIGRTAEGRTQWMLVVSAPENLLRLERFREISARLARAEGVDEAEARTLAAEGRAVVWIDGGLHANETAATHQLIETAWLLASATDDETTRVLRETIVLLVHANPDGHELVSNWYRRERNPALRVLTPAPRLYQEHAGHDNNRDFYMSALPETTNLNRQLYLEWFPQIVYDHHQSAPAGTAMFVPPFRDPFNHVFDPLVIAGVEALGNAIQTRLLLEEKPGVTSREGANYSTWFNGSLRTTAYFHNLIGLLSEVAGGPNPMRLALVPQRQLASNDLLLPIPPRPWRFRDAIDYSVSANRAVLDHAARNRGALLYNVYRMGRNAIERGRRDHWTTRPRHLAEVTRLAVREGAATFLSGGETDGGDLRPMREIPARFHETLRRPEWRDPRAFVVPADQPDFPTAVKFVNALLKSGIAVHRARERFTVDDTTYPAGSYVVKTDQAFRPHILDMFEPQDHPDDFAPPGGAPTKPYDAAGWTLALQMGVRFDRVLEGFEAPLERLPYGALQTPPAPAFDGTAAGFLIDPAANDSATLVNRLLREGADVFWVRDGTARRTVIHVPNQGPARQIAAQAAAELGLRLQPLARPPGAIVRRLAPVRIALWDRFGGSISSGWTRWVLEHFEFPFTRIYAPEIDAGGLRDKYDAILLVDGALQAPDAAVPPAPPRDVAAGYSAQIGRITDRHSIPKLRQFLEHGGTIVALGSSTRLAFQLGLPVQRAFVERNENGTERTLAPDELFVPGSLLEAKIAGEELVATGMPAHALFYFNHSPAFVLSPEAVARGIRPIAWFDTATPLRSGWAWGQSHLHDAVIAARAPVGDGALYLFGCDVAFRAQSHGTFKLLFNALHLAAASRD